MTDDVKTCVDARTNYFGEYFSVPSDLQSDVEVLVSEITELGEQCISTEEFENKFVSTGLSDRFSSLISQCEPIARKMTKDEKRQSRDIAKGMLRENKKEIAEYAAESAAMSARVAVSEEVTTRVREKMIEDGTLADYTIAKNVAEDTERLFGFLGKKFGRNKGK